MNKLPVIIGISAIVLLGGCTMSGRIRQHQSNLAPCSAEGTMFALLPLEEWPKRYHETVRDVSDAHVASFASLSNMPLNCAGTGSVFKPSEKLQTLAAGLPAWKGQRLSTLSENDAPAVLLELLRVYECSLNEKRTFMATDTASTIDNFFGWGELAKKTDDRRTLIANELTIARPALERTLQIIAGFDRLRPLSTDIECIKRASLDLRNTLGLTADASACMPRSFDVHGSLRDLPSPINQP